MVTEAQSGTEFKGEKQYKELFTRRKEKFTLLLALCLSQCFASCIARMGRSLILS